MARASGFDESPDYVQSLARGLQVLRAFDQSLPQASLSEIAERTGLARAVVRRNLLTLQQTVISWDVSTGLVLKSHGPSESFMAVPISLIHADRFLRRHQKIMTNYWLQNLI